MLQSAYLLLLLLAGSTAAGTPVRVTVRNMCSAGTDETEHEMVDNEDGAALFTLNTPPGSIFVKLSGEPVSVKTEKDGLQGCEVVTATFGDEVVVLLVAEDAVKGRFGAQGDSRAAETLFLRRKKDITAKYHVSGEYPELSADFDLVNRTADFGLTFNGGGARAAVATSGILRALHYAGLLPSIRYSSAVSGSAWASAPHAFKTGVSEEEFLGPFTPHGSEGTIDMASLAVGDKSIIATVASERHPGFLAKVIGYLFAPGWDLSDFYGLAVCDRFTKPFGLASESAFTFSKGTQEDIVSRNPSLAEQSFSVLDKNVPYPIITTLSVAPYDLLPINIADIGKKYRVIDNTPLSVGVPQEVAEVEFQTVGSEKSTTVAMFGGTVEPVGHDGSTAAFDAPSKTFQTTVNRPYNFARLLGAASFPFFGTTAYGDTGIIRPLTPQQKFNPVMPLADSSTLESNFAGENWGVGDGGAHDEYGLIPLLRRQVKNIVVTISSDTPLSCTNDAFDRTRITRETGFKGRIHPMFPAYFGHPESEPVFFGAAWSAIHVFDSEKVFEIITGLEDAVLQDRPVVYQADGVQVVRNKKHGVEPYVVNLTFVYVAMDAKDRSARRNKGFHKLLADDVFQALEEDQWPNFPNYATSFQGTLVDIDLPLGMGRFTIPASILGLREKESSLLAEYVSWTFSSFLATEQGKEVAARMAAVGEKSGL